MYFRINDDDSPFGKTLEIGPTKEDVPSHSSDWIPDKVNHVFESISLFELMEGIYEISDRPESDLRSLLKNLGFTEIKTKHQFEVIENSCRCHPETCCCDDYKIVDEKGNQYASGMDKDKLQDLVDQANGKI